MAEIGEGELRMQLERGGHITGVIVVARPVDDAVEYTPFLLLSWRRGYFHIRRARGGERRWREFDRLFKALREFNWTEAIPVHNATDPKLLRVRAIAEALGASPVLRPRKQRPLASDLATEDDTSTEVTAGEDKPGPA